MALISKSSLTSTFNQDPEKYVHDVDADFVALFLALRKAPQVSKGVVAPTSTPVQVGDIYVDTAANKVYFATGITNSADWTAVN